MFRKAIIEYALAEFTCLVGTMTQEAYNTFPEIRDAFGHAETLEPDIAEALEMHGMEQTD